MSNEDFSDIGYDDDRFVSVSDFKECMRWHGEVVFEWKGLTYSVTPDAHGNILISHSRKRETEIVYKSADDLLEYIAGGDRLRDVITEVDVLERTI